MAMGNVVIVGGGQAAACAAAALRKAGFDGRLSIVGDEPHLPYERPPLSKEVLAGGYDRAKALVHPESFYAEQDILLARGARATAIEPGRRRVTTDAGETLPYDRLLIATGCRARQLAGVPPRDGRVAYLRTLADAEAIGRRLDPGSRVLLIGGGFIGLEVAAAARARGCEATVLEAAPALLGRVMPAAAARHLEELHLAQGVEIVTGACLESLEHDGSALLARCSDGRRFAADLAVVGIGARPNQELAEAAGLACRDGVLVDACARTAAPDIFAAGDVTRHPNAFHELPVRLESWDNARRQAETAARNLLGATESYDEIPWMWTDHYGCNVQMLGLREEGCETVLRGRPGDGPFAVLSCRDGRVRGAVLFDLGRERRPLTRLMRSGLAVPPEQLADPAVPLRALAEREAA